LLWLHWLGSRPGAGEAAPAAPRRSFTPRLDLHRDVPIFPSLQQSLGTGQPIEWMSIEIFWLQPSANAFFKAPDAQTSPEWLHAGLFPNRVSDHVHFGFVIEG